MKVDGSDYEEKLKEVAERNKADKAENEVCKKRMQEINSKISMLLEYWDKWHLKEIEKGLTDSINDIDKLLDSAFDLRTPDSDTLLLIYCLGHSKNVIKKYVKNGIPEEILNKYFEKVGKND